MTSPSLDRRAALKGSLAAVAALAGGPVFAADDTSLAKVAQSRGLVFGSACQEEIFTDLAYRRLFVEQAAILVPQNQMKFGALQPQRGIFDFAPADRLIDAARSKGLMARGHTLFWNDWPPDWLKTLSHAEVARTFDVYLDRVVTHFAGRLQSWDVVNEPFWLGKDKPGTFRPGPWYDAMGPDYIFRAFRRTAELDPHVKLVLNEAWTERSDEVGLAVRASLLRLVDRIQDKGLKLDAVGLQGHLLPGEPYDDDGFLEFLSKLAERKVDIYITEFDVDDHTFPDDVAERDAAVAKRATEFLSTALKVPAVTMLVTWGLSDRYTWWREPSVMEAYGQVRLPRPLPYDDMLEKKPLWHAMRRAFAERDTGPAPG